MSNLRAILLLPLLAAAGCMGQDSSVQAQEPGPVAAVAAAGAGGATIGESVSQAAAPAGNVLAGDLHPCDYFTPVDLTALFGADAQAAVVERGVVQRNATCKYTWPNPADRKAIQKRNEAVVKEAMGSSGDLSAMIQKIKSNSEPTEFELFITFHHGGDFVNEAHAIAGLDAMVDSLSKGVGNKDFSFQSRFEASEGIGAKAVWSESLRQVSAVSGTQYFHTMLHRNASPQADRANAESVARTIAAAL